MTLLFAGLAVGAVYAIVAYGYNLTYTTSGVLNFATAHMTMLGTFIAASLMSGSGMPLWIIVGACLAIGAAVGFLVELTAVAPLKSYRLRRSGTGAAGHGELVTTVGASTIITGLAFIVWGSDPLRVPLFADDSRFPFLGGQIRPSDLTVILVAVVVGLALHFWTRASRLGLASLAQTEDRDAAMLQGINVRLLSSLGFTLAGGLGCALGVVVGAKTLAVVGFALVLAIKGFVALTLGGVGSHLGAMIGAGLLGVGEVMTARWVGTEYRSILVFLVFITVLLLRPQGLFGTARGRTV